MSEGGISSELPKGWTWARLGDLGAECREPVVAQEGQQYELWSVPSFASRRPEILDGKEIGSAKFRTAVGDVLVCKINPRINRVWMVGAEFSKFPRIASPEWLILRVPESVKEVVGPYLRWYLSAPGFRKWITGAVSGATGSHTRAKARGILEQPIPFPPLEEQRRIVAALEEQLSRLDAADRNLLTGARRIERYLQAALHQATSPYSLVQLRDVLASGLANGRSVPTRAGGFRVLRLTALSETCVDLQQYKEGDWEESEANPFLVQQGDFLIARGNGSLSLVGRGALVGDVSHPVAYPDTMIRVRLDTEKILPDYLRMVWSSLAVRRQIESQARTTAGIYKVNQKILGGIYFPLPDLQTQHTLCARWSQTEQQTRHLTHTVSITKRRSAMLRRSLLTEAFAGRLAPQGPADEPVEVLLTRIRAEREAAGVTKSRRSPRRAPSQRKRTATPAAPPPPRADAPALATATQPTLDLEMPS